MTRLPSTGKRRQAHGVTGFRSDDDVEAELLELRRRIEETVEKHRQRRAQDALITAVGTDRTDVVGSARRLAAGASATVDILLADAEYLEAAQAVCDHLLTAGPDVHLRLLCTSGMLSVGLLDSAVLERPNTEVRVARVPMLQVLLVDGRAAMVAAPSAAGRQASVIRATSVIRALDTLFEGLWWQSVAMEDRVEFCDAGRTTSPARILECLRAGVTDEVAARELSISIRTYRRCVAEIMTVLGANSRFQAGVRAAELGLLSEEAGLRADRSPGGSAARTGGRGS
ncbi:helix-turn-helix transcriptional regulator [Streptomyces sp. GSL17-111]|uniref:helix-turn-helix transcriptional regulator n=1 Tax=Streptomyces sp. GSL17-111 TaxID=3121596 RepID=UPI0030F49D1F